MAEREGFEPSDPVRDHLISSQARSAAPAPLLRLFTVIRMTRRDIAW